MSAAEKRHVERVKSLSCAVCDQSGPSDAHHILEGRIKGRRCSDFCTIPLCKGCHQGPNGIHGDRAMWKVYRKTELECLAETIGRLYGGVR